MSVTEKPRWAAVVSLALGIFTLVVIEQLPIGVLTLIADDLRVSRGTVGLSVTIPGILAGVVALLVPGLTAAFDRKNVLVGSLLAVIASSVLSALAPSYPLLLASRILTGFAIGMYWPVLPLLAVSQVPPRRKTTALTIAYAGTGTALVLGLPLATALGTAMGWRGAFVATAVLAAVTLVLALVLVAPLRSPVAETVASTFGAARIKGVRYAFALTLIVVTAQFVSYSYISPMLQDMAGVHVKNTTLYLLVYGILGVVGNFAVGPLIQRSATLAVLVMSGGTGLAVALVALAMREPIGAMALIGLWGFFGGMASVAIQSLVNDQAGERVEAGTALNSAAYNAAIGSGAVIGGIIVDAAGLYAALWVTVAGFAAGFALLVRLRAVQR